MRGRIEEKGKEGRDAGRKKITREQKYIRGRGRKDKRVRGLKGRREVNARGKGR